jgi:hypothetical protein
MRLTGLQGARMNWRLGIIFAIVFIAILLIVRASRSRR